MAAAPLEWFCKGVTSSSSFFKSDVQNSSSCGNFHYTYPCKCTFSTAAADYQVQVIQTASEHLFRCCFVRKGSVLAPGKRITLQ